MPRIKPTPDEETVKELIYTHGCAACPDRCGPLCQKGGGHPGHSVAKWVENSMKPGSPEIRPTNCPRFRQGKPPSGWADFAETLIKKMEALEEEVARLSEIARKWHGE